MDKDASEFLRNKHNVDVDSEFLEKSIFAQKKFDIICAFQVMEHVDDPITFLKSIKNCSKKGTKIFIEVPNLYDPLLSVWNIPFYKKFYYHSAHLHYFTKDSLKKIASDVGFKESQIKINFIQDYNLLNHLHWLMNDEPQKECHVGLSEINIKGYKCLFRFMVKQRNN